MKRKRKKNKKNKNINFTGYGYTAYLYDGVRFFSTQSPLRAFTVYHFVKVLGLQNYFIKLFDFVTSLFLCFFLCVLIAFLCFIASLYFWPKIPIY